MLKDEWINHCLDLGCLNPQLTFSCGARKIITNHILEFTTLDDSLHLSDVGYTKSKLTMLTKHYLHNESRNVALHLWDKRREQAKYGSVGFTTYAHFVKGGSVDSKRSRIASVFGPCIQSVVITWLTKETYSLDVFYRTTELLKKFPADLVLLRDVLMPGFYLDGMKSERVTCHFANITMHPMYWVTIIPHLEIAIDDLEQLESCDPYMFKWVCKWTARYVCPEHLKGILKFSQAMRVKKFADERITGRLRTALVTYLRKQLKEFGTALHVEEDDEDT